MRVIKELVNGNYKTTIFNWNNKYIIKLETPSFEQTYKIDQYDLGSDEEAVALLDDHFVLQILKRFDQMAEDMGKAMDRLDK